MGIEFTSSADRHGVAHDDVIHAIANADGEASLSDGSVVWVGRPHPQTERRIEVIARPLPPRTILVFHAMELSDKYRSGELTL